MRRVGPTGSRTCSNRADRAAGAPPNPLGADPSEQRTLCPCRGVAEVAAKAREVQRDALVVQAQPRIGLLESLYQQLSPDALPVHALSEAAVVVAPAAHVL